MPKFNDYPISTRIDLASTVVQAIREAALQVPLEQNSVESTVWYNIIQFSIFPMLFIFTFGFLTYIDYDVRIDNNQLQYSNDNNKENDEPRSLQ